MVRRTIKRLAHLAAAAVLILPGLSACDFLVTAFPQGYANDALTYTDPRWEARARVDDPKLFGVAVDTSGPSSRVFVIGAEAVYEFDAELNPVRDYVPANMPRIEAYSDGKGPEQWYAEPMATTPPVMRLYGAFSGTAIYLFNPGGTALVRKFGSDSMSSFMLNTLSFDQPPAQVVFDGSSTVSWSGINAGDALPMPRAGFYDWASDQVHVLNEASMESNASGAVAYTINKYVYPRASGGASIETLPYRTPAVNPDFAVDRLTLDGSMLVMGLSNRAGELSSYRSLAFLYERYGSGLPLASFSSYGSAVQATADSIYVLSAGNDGAGYVHKLRWLP